MPARSARDTSAWESVSRATVLLHGRDQGRAEALATELRAAGATAVRVYLADLASLAEVRSLAADPMLTRSYGGVRAYCQSKLAQILDTIDLADDSPSYVTGKFFNGVREARADAQAYDREARAKLRSLSEKLAAR